MIRCWVGHCCCVMRPLPSARGDLDGEIFRPTRSNGTPGYSSRPAPGTAGGGAQCNIGAFDERTRVTTQRQSRIHHTGHVTGEFPLEASRESSGVGQWERSPVCCFRDDNDNDYRKRKYRTSLYEDSRTYSKEFLELRHLLPFFSLIDPVNSASGSGEHLSSPVEVCDRALYIAEIEFVYFGLTFDMIWWPTKFLIICLCGLQNFPFCIKIGITARSQVGRHTATYKQGSIKVIKSI